jgi:hypothetical protein
MLISDSVSILKISVELSITREAINCVAIKELRILRNPKVHYCIPKSPPLITNLCQTNTVPISPRSISILSTHLNLGLPSGLLPSGFPANNLYAFLFLPFCATRHTYLILHLIITQTISFAFCGQ